MRSRRPCFPAPGRGSAHSGSPAQCTSPPVLTGPTAWAPLCGLDWRPPNLYGSLPGQLADPDSFAARLSRVLAVRSKHGLASGALVDLPDVTSAVIERVCREAGSQPTGAITESLARAAYGGIPGHPVLLGRAHWTGVQRAAVGDQGARGYLQGRDVRLIECGDLATGADVDTQAEWTRMMDP